jgi:hypothetical protein
MLKLLKRLLGREERDRPALLEGGNLVRPDHRGR